MTVTELVNNLLILPPHQEVCFYIPELERPGDTTANNWRDPVRIEAVECEHDDYVLIELGRV